MNVASLGRIVHYVLPATSVNAGQHRAAILTGAHVGGLTRHLTVFFDHPNDMPGDPELLEDSPCVELSPLPEGVENQVSGEAMELRAQIQWMEHVNDVPFDSSGLPGTWHWPEMVANPGSEES